MSSKYRVSLSIVLLAVLHVTVIIRAQQDPNQFDQILKELDILTRQQLQAQAAIETTTSASNGKTSGSTTTSQGSPIPKKLPTSVGKSRLDSTASGSSSSNQKVFSLPSSYDPNKLPRYSRIKPLMVKINLTILHVNLDKIENTVNVDVEIIESWKDKRLRIRKSNDKNDSEEDMNSDDDEDDSSGSRQRKGESYLLEPEWASRIWHPVSRLQGNAQIVVQFSSPSRASKDDGQPEFSRGTNLGKQKPLEQENSIKNIVVMSNETTAHVLLALKIRVKIPTYECYRDDSSLYPFDKIACTIKIANVMYDKRNLQYKWHNINWLHNGYHTGEFYLRDLTNSIESEPLLDLDNDNSEHSTMRMEILLKRQIGDYILNVYLLHMFLLALCVASFWISIDNIVIRMSLSIIVLIIIKFQTIQTLKDDRHIVSALSIWTFGLSCLVILSLLGHILSYYSVQHKWNDKILNRLIQKKGDRGQRTPNGGDIAGNRGVSFVTRREQSQVESNLPAATEVPESIEHVRDASTANAIPMPTPITVLEKEPGSAFQQRWNKVKQNSLVWLNSIILSNSRKDEGYDRINLVDIIARSFLLIIYLLFVLIYFCTYVF